MSQAIPPYCLTTKRLPRTISAYDGLELVLDLPCGQGAAFTKREFDCLYELLSQEDARRHVLVYYHTPLKLHAVRTGLPFFDNTIHQAHRQHGEYAQVKGFSMAISRAERTADSMLHIADLSVAAFTPEGFTLAEVGHQRANLHQDGRIDLGSKV